MAATLFSTALSHHFIPLTSAKPSSIAAASFACGPLRAVSALLAPRRRLLLPVAVAEVTSDLETEEVEEEGEGGGDSEAEYSEDLKVFVGNLPFTVDSEQLAGLFEQAGSVEMVEVIYDRMTGRSRGFGFVTMSSVEEVKAAVEQFNGYTFQGRPLRVNSGPPPPRDEFAPRTPRTFGAGGGGGGGGNFDSGNKLYVGNLSWGVDNSTLENLFSEQGQVLDAKVIYDRDSGRSRGFGFVTYGSAEEVNKAISKLDGVVRSCMHFNLFAMPSFRACSEVLRLPASLRSAAEQHRTLKLHGARSEKPAKFAVQNAEHLFRRFSEH